MDIRLLYRDDYLFICEKPVGISSESPGLPDLVAQQTGHPVYPVHRLDRGTGGVIILALSPSSCAAIQRLFLHDSVEKEYLAVVSGRLPKKSGTCSDLLFHDRKLNKSFIADKPRKGVKKAFCEWEELSAVVHENHTFSLLKISLHTGRTHQIRVQFASRGYPLVGDRRYGSRAKADTVALWAYSIRFPHPFISSRIISAASSIPDSYPWNLFRFS